MRILLHADYPKYLVEALNLIHSIQRPRQFEIIRAAHFDQFDVENCTVFLFDWSKKGLDIVTEKHFQAGYKVFAFKLNSAPNLDFFQLSLITLKLWPEILRLIKEKETPFIFTYNYHSRRPKEIKGS